ncbi:protein-disulfide reductase DsbD family protein [Niveispirillum cyanobacteriorum]|uniref:Thiol:disulfide interchange protein n=1 Tax=Niveispirillum cyanobacteriorum TaxID=1612173 RepID=A0A2K9N7Q0_9PROT|nr:thioredoxin family protein [Niveispirillum cyanobacteriorum]AUN29171.1 thiol:disulfide interchange protein [Niveispirillum cyanobacteriorum]GGE66819.1 thiol:disulfide interchange protein DsbD [Niveispirillum cyanobacteriorum]
MKKFGLSTLCALLLAGAVQAAPIRSNLVATDNVETFITLETQGMAPGQTVWAALTQNIRPHWHTYWINPGDSGIPTEIKWTLPEGWKADAITWPAPQRFPIGPLVNFGYADQVHLLVPLTVPANATPGQAVKLDAKVDWLVCEDICIPESADLSIAVPVVAGTAAVEPEAAPLFTKARASLPVPSPYTATLAPGDKAHRLTLAAPGLDKGKISEVFFFPHDYKVASSNAAQELRLGADGLTLSLVPGGALPAGPVTGVLSFTEELDGQSVRHAFAVEAAVGAAAPASTGEQTSWATALLLALLGGAVLNLMPCVFPVLSMKALALLQHGPAHARRHGLAYTAGVLACFAIVAGALIALRAGGAAIGWGFQLQDPLVVAILAYVMLLLGLSLSGVFTLGGSVMGVGQGLAGRDGLAGSFFTGVLATVVATPCTAPFMGTALGFAITQPWPVALSVFLALGLGMALPFLALSFSPALLKRLPRPGLWMERVKQALAFPLYASAAWLVWVLSIQAGPAALATVLAGMVAIAFAAWVYGQTRLSGGPGRAFGSLLAVLALGGAVAGASTARTVPVPEQVAGAKPASSDYQPWTAEKLAELTGQGKPVFVNFTAAWCVTCLVNERTSLSTDAVKAAMKAKGVAYLKGDWTNRDATIARVLESHGRSGVPLYLVYLPGKAEPVILPQILTEGIVLDALSSLPNA